MSDTPCACVCEDGGEERCACEGQEEEETEHREDEDAHAYAVLCGAFMDAYVQMYVDETVVPGLVNPSYWYGVDAVTPGWTGLIRTTGLWLAAWVH